MNATGAATCGTCGQRAGTTDGKFNTHQKPGGGKCEGSGKDA